MIDYKIQESSLRARSTGLKTIENSEDEKSPFKTPCRRCNDNLVVVSKRNTRGLCHDCKLATYEGTLKESLKRKQQRSVLFELAIRLLEMNQTDPVIRQFIRQIEPVRHRGKQADAAVAEAMKIMKELIDNDTR